MALVVLAVIVTLHQDTFYSVSGKFEAEKAKKLADDIHDSAYLVYQQGVGASTKIYATIPAGVEEINISGNEIRITMYINGQKSDIVRSTGFPITGNITIDPGNLWLNINSHEGYVLVNSTFTEVSAQCGNNVRESGEQCDGSDLGLYSCVTLGYTGGTLTCKADCTFNTSSCFIIYNQPPFINWTNATPPIVSPGSIVKIRAYVYDHDNNLANVTVQIDGTNHSMQPYEEYHRYSFFTDGFETGNLSLWNLTGTGAPWFESTTYPNSGIYHASAQLTGNTKYSYMERVISLASKVSINLSYYKRLTLMDALDDYIVDWWNGTAWTILEQLGGIDANDSYYVYKSYLLPASADNNANFRLRFACENNMADEFCNVDDISMSALTMAPLANEFYFDFNTSGLSAGTHNYTVFANDTYSYNATPKIGSFIVSSDTTPPASVTNLNETAWNTTWILWNWTNPADADFSQVIIYLNGTNVANTSDNHYNATGLMPSTKYMISTRTKDIYGNINTTWVNDTAYTSTPPDTTPPATVTGLNETKKGSTWILWNWTNPLDIDFAKVILYLNGTNIANTSNSSIRSYNVTNLTPSTTYRLTTNTMDTTGNINITNISDLATTNSPTYVRNISAQTCVAEDNAAKGTFGSACLGTYPAACPSDRLTCNDGATEDHIAVRTGVTRTYGGVKISSFNSSVTCSAVTKVRICYEWWQNSALQDCDISVDASGGASFTLVNATCPLTTLNPGLVCEDVTTLEPWTCSSFFGASGTRAQAKSEAQRGGTVGTTTVSWDSLFFEVTYN